uniref:ATP-dependent DNA helicase n=1 Tax=Rhabditophanes sp. KR3021 TaxID=114890 RepID=A0AC35TJN0_9BILA
MAGKDDYDDDFWEDFDDVDFGPAIIDSESFISKSDVSKSFMDPDQDFVHTASEEDEPVEEVLNVAVDIAEMKKMDEGVRFDMHGKFRGFFDDSNAAFQNEDMLGLDLVTMMYSKLKALFGHNTFRHSQKPAIVAALMSNDIFVLMPTGAGKSLVYQLCAALNDGITFVISPLRALIHDQVTKMNQIGLKTIALTSDNTEIESKKNMKMLFSDNNNIKLVYITPEKIASSPQFNRDLKKLHSMGKIARFVFDEAHCVSGFGHDFRPDYLSLSKLRTEFQHPRVPMMALTATATPKCVADTKQLLGFGNDSKLFISSFVRDNLEYDVILKKAKAKEEIMRKMFLKFPGQSGIVYCLSKKDTEKAAEDLRKWGITATHYHAGMTKQQRHAAQKEWMDKEVLVLCATIAFGMGIDMPDVRFVVHYSIPKSVEGYYQESGRAGRDGLPAYCAILYNYNDSTLLSKFIQDEITNEDGSAIVKSSTVKEMQMGSLHEVIAYCENVETCKRKLLVEHFGEIYDSLACKITVNAVCCNCLNYKKEKHSTYDMTDDATIILQSVKHAKLTVNQAIDNYRGNDKARGQKLEMFNRRPAFSESDASRVIIKLLTEGYIKIVVVSNGNGKFAGISGQIHITRKGEKFLSREESGKFYVSICTERKRKAPGKTVDSGLSPAQRVHDITAMQHKYQTKYKDIFEGALAAIKRLITQIAKEEVVRENQILTIEGINQIAALLPRTNSDLLKVSSMNLQKLTKHGPAIMETLVHFWQMVDSRDKEEMHDELESLKANPNQRRQGSPEIEVPETPKYSGRGQSKRGYSYKRGGGGGRKVSTGRVEKTPQAPRTPKAPYTRGGGGSRGGSRGGQGASRGGTTWGANSRGGTTRGGSRGGTTRGASNRRGATGSSNFPFLDPNMFPTL